MIGFVQPTLLINHLQRFPKISCNTWKQEGSWSYCWIRKLSNPKTFSPFHSVQIYISTSAPEKKNLKNIRRTRMLHLLGYSMLNNQFEFYRKNILGENHYLTTFLPTSFYFLSWNVTDFFRFWFGLVMGMIVGKMVVAQQLTLIFILWYLYLSVGFHDKYQSYKYVWKKYIREIWW